MSKLVRSSGTRAALLKIGYDYSWWRYLYPNKRQLAFPEAIKQLNEIKIPALVVTAQYDLLLCQTIADILAKEIPVAKFVSLKSAGHMMNMDNPEEFNGIVLTFIEQIKKSPAN